MKATEQGNQYCNYCKKETWHTPKLGLVFENKRLCEECSTSNTIEEKRIRLRLRRNCS